MSNRRCPEPRLILVSSSPRRRELLETAGWPVRVLPVAVDETPWAGETPADYVRRLAQAKAQAGASAWPAESGGGTDPVLLLAADTTVACADEILGKPADAQEARRMLRRLSGAQHRVLTGVCALDPAGGFFALEVAATEVWMLPWREEEIAAYVAGGEPMDKAGAYAIQGFAGQFVTRIEGSYSNVVGLPLASVREIWDRWMAARLLG